MQLPSGTVTFLFTDIEGSTRILQRSGDGFASLLEAHAAIIRDEVRARGGMEVSTEGDAFFCVFTGAPQAVAAAVGIQQALAAHPWPGDPVRVRIGLHTGEGRLGGDDYVGLDVNRAARVSNAGHGGQTLMTAVTCELASAALPDGVTVRDMGRHRLKDLDAPEHLFQLVVTGLPADFPPLRSIDARPNNLPAELTSFVGRRREIEAIGELLAAHRLLTLTGPGGTGKTRLARRVAWDALGAFEDGVWFVDLSQLDDPALVPSAIGDVLGVREQPDEPLIRALAAHLATRRLLLVLDNFEQVTGGSRVIAELLAAAPGLSVLVTSRGPLHLYGEQEFPVPTLTVPPAPAVHAGAERAGEAMDEFVSSDAIRLFLERARAARPDFQLDPADAPWVAAICRRLDGLPLAIELAAARVKLLPPKALSERLERSLSVLSASASELPARQRTLRGAIDWSYHLLDPADCELFARLAVFAGGFTLDMAEAVVAGAIDGGAEVDVLAGVDSLLDKSLLRSSRDEHAGEVRLGMLETIREYAAERLEGSGVRPALRQRHAKAFAELVERAQPELTGAHLATWLDRLGHEHDNLRAALRWCLESGDTATGLRLGAAAWRFWQQRGHLTEGREWLRQLLEKEDARDDRPRFGRALIAAGGLAYWQRDYADAERLYQMAHESGKEIDDLGLVAESTYNLGWIRAVNHDNETALALWRQSQDISRALGDEVAVARVAQYLGFGHFMAGQPVLARAAFEEARAYFRRTGGLYEVADSSVGMAESWADEGRLRESRQEFEYALEVFAEAGNVTGIAMALQGLAAVAHLAGEVEAAVRIGAAADRLEEQVGGGAPRTLAPYHFGSRQRTEARARLGDERYDRLWSEGRALDVDAARDLVRATPLPPDGPSAIPLESRLR